MYRSHPDRAVREAQLNLLLGLASHPDDRDRYGARGREASGFEATIS